MRKTQGLSLIELIIVVVIIGVLIAVALPKLLDMAEDAQKTGTEWLAGRFATSVMSARAQWEAEGRPSVVVAGERYNFVDYDGVELWLTRAQLSDGSSTGYRDGYPVALKKGDINFPNEIDTKMCVDLMKNLLQNSPTVVDNLSSDSDARYLAQADNVNTQCVYLPQYARSERQMVYNIATGMVSVVMN
ncbi:prepilin-type N-terminal cleavage/methylation domain-containing protein [Vibrio profundum]|uniref:prepilin-type N-terminal cleavage/methylation domain-containing protein n=1 Tax=Vibrio profundum TaxID=2910247 RepID=UPI003D0D4C12